MVARTSRWLAGVAAAVVAGAGTGALAAPLTASAATAGSQPVNHSNVGAAHSPRLLRMLAGPASAAGARGPATAAGAGGPAAIRGSAVIVGAAQGVDVASYQHPGGAGINWASVASAGIKFAAVKATEGAYYQNPYAPGDLTGARGAGLSTVAYAFGIPNGNGSTASAAAQADYLLSYLTSAAVSPPPPVMLDIEYNPYGAECYGLTQPAMVSWINAFSDEVAAKTGRLPILYSTQDWLATCTGDSTALRPDPLWIAHYTPDSNPAPLPANWTDWGIWQYTSTGSVTGISGNVDLDQLNPDSFLAPGQLIVFNPGAQHGVAGAPLAAALPVNTYPEESGAALTFSQAGLPGSLTLNSSTGQITGTEPPLGPSHVTVSVADATSKVTGSVGFTWYSTDLLNIAPAGNQATDAGGPVDLQLSASSSALAPVTFTATGLPPGLAITGAGLVTGWPGTPGTYQVTATATDSLMGTASVSFGWTVSLAPDAGPTGLVRLDLAGKCLNDVGNRSGNGTQSDIWTCNGSAAQRWTHVQDGTLRMHGRCLAAPGTTGGTRVALQPCTDGAGQQWQLVYPRGVNAAAGATPVGLVNPGSGLCLSDSGFRQANGTRVIIWGCDGLHNQAWTLQAGPAASQLPGLCLDDRGSRIVNGNTIDVWSCNGTAAQQWTAGPDGSLRVRGKCLDIYHAATASGSPVDLYSCNGTAAQQWRLIQRGAGAQLVNPDSGLCLADPGDSTVRGTGLQIITCSAAPGASWRVQ